MDGLFLKWNKLKRNEVNIIYRPTQEDISILKQSDIKSKIKIELLELKNGNLKTIDTLENVLINDNYSIDADSDIRRSYEGSFYVKDPSFFIGENKKIWIDKFIRIWKGTENAKTKKFVWYNMGIYLFNDTSYVYDVNNNTVTINCVDMMSKYNDTFSGQISGATLIRIPCQEEIVELINVPSKFWVKEKKRNENIVGYKACVLAGTEITLSLGKPYIGRWGRQTTCRYKDSYIHILGAHFINNEGTPIADSSEFQFSIRTEKGLKKDEIYSVSATKNIKIPITLDMKTITLGFLQNIAFEKLIVRYIYKDMETLFPVDHKFNITWNFSSDKYLYSNSYNTYLKDKKYTDFTVIGFTVNNSTKTIIKDYDKMEEDEKSDSYLYGCGKYTFTIDTTERAVEQIKNKPIKWYSTVINTLKNWGITNYIVEYTEDEIPYDLEFSTGVSVYDILKELVNLLANWEMFFDVEGVLHIQPIPMLYEDDIMIDNETLSPLIISENKKDSFSSVRNVTEIWGMSINPNYYTEVCENNINDEGHQNYKATFEDLILTDEGYIPNDTIIGIKIPTTNSTNPYLSITAQKLVIEEDNNGVITSYEYITTDPIPILNLSGEDLLENTFNAETAYCLKYYKGYFYFLGQFQVHAICLEVKNEPNEEQKLIYKEKYVCDNIYYSVNPSSPYCVEKIGERIQVLSGDEYDNIYSNQLAIERAKWENWKKTRRQETISIQMIDVPWLDVNCKIEYKSLIDGDINQYIIKHISSETQTGIMTVELMRFYPLYILDAKQYEAIEELKSYEKYLVETYLYSKENKTLLELYLNKSIVAINEANSIEEVALILNNTKNLLNNIEKQ